ncbi:hypothetical protein BT96DRAFT_974930 [Gymnopus androsaceus JB14]|uniref:F-box domain-containing protein n=1 Tax=Gymnopus androsaceus JB14 TaxID=1447944 RepID=A0A6A4HW83_9AGAR|nr:hypothetical protein BT96DRAFT_974930 [Gymnopus androsaceus JB14]
MPYQSSFQPRVAISSIQELLRSHHGLGSFNMDCAKIQQILADGEKDLETYSSEISLLQSELLLIEKKKERLKDQLEGCRSLLAPIRRVPDDILGTVFSNLCNVGPDTEEIQSAAFRLSTVCSHWRSIILATPSLWATIAFSFPLERSSAAKLVQLHLERSKAALLDLSISTGWEELSPANMAEQQNHPAFLALIEQSHRWLKIVIGGKNAYTFLQGGASSYPALRSLEIRSGQLRPPTLAPPAMRQLSSLTLRGFSVSSGLSFPWSQLTRLVLDINSIKKISDFLSLCTNLDSLEMKLDFSFQGVREDLPAMNGNIKTLRLSLAEWEDGHGEESIERVFTTLVLPGLTSMHIEVDPKYPLIHSPGPSIAAFLKRSRFNLTVLSLTYVYISDDELLSLLRDMPSVVDLKANSESMVFPVTPTFISSLHAFRQPHSHCSSPLLPNLERISLLARTDVDFDEVAFVEMITSRWVPNQAYAKEIGVVCLQRAELHLGQADYLGQVIRFADLDLMKFAPLKILRQRGMVIDVFNAGEVVEI